jgi:hypothetical protein
MTSPNKPLIQVIPFPEKKKQKQAMSHLGNAMVNEINDIHPKNHSTYSSIAHSIECKASL